MSKKSFDEKKESESYNELLTLTPRVLEGEEKERIKPYLTRLKQAIDQEDIRNIALTGNYGSGKSTILKTFQHYNKKGYKYLPITLALFGKYNGAFSEEKKEKIASNNASENDKKDFEKKLELSILQQIFYRESADNIPGSRFKRIKDFDNNKTFWTLVFSTVWLISVLFLFGLNQIANIDPRYWDINEPFSWYVATLFIVFSIGIYHFLKYGIRKFSNSKLNKVSFKGEFEFGDASVFNNYLDEIIYFFEKTEYNVVVFEDIDRFDTTRIFTKLRELNNLVNNCDIIDREINFIYAIKDTLFKDKTERVKFFDFIIPVIPFVNSKNASEQLNKLIKKHKLSDKLSKKFVSEVVSMIHDIDMRLLRNTFHEYTVFKDNIGDENFNHERLFSIIVYKNLYPEDFSKLYREEGKLFDVINKKEGHLAALTKEFENEIQKLEDKIESLNQHSHIQINELRAVYILKMLENLPVGVDKIVFGGNKVRTFELIEENNFKELMRSKNIKHFQSAHNRSGNSRISFSQIESQVNSEHSYIEREQFIKDRKKNKVNSIKSKILVKKDQIREIKKLSLAEIFEKIESEKIYGEFKDNALVRYLLIGGYLNENYLDYISLFHEVNLTRKEFRYLRSIKSNKEPDFEFEIENNYALVNELDTRYFSYKSTLNYDLVEYLVDQSSQFRDKINMFYSSLANREEIYLEFLVVFLKERSSCRKKFIPNLIKHRKSFWDELSHDSNLPEEEILEVVKYLLEYSSGDDLKQLENVESLKGYFEEIENPISVGASLVNRKTFENFITAQSVKFKSLDKPENSSNQFFEFVLKSEAFEINYSNVLLILSTKLSDVEESEIKQSIYTHVRESDIVELKYYIEENLNEFVSKVLLHKKGSHSETEDSIIALLNEKNLDTELKKQLIILQKYRISSLEKLDNYEEKEIVISANKMKPNWNNVFHYYDQLDESSLNETIINFLNNEENYAELSEGSVIDLSEIKEGKLLNFRDDILYCTKLNLIAYKSLLKSLTPIDSIEFSWLNVDMAKILLEKDTLNMIPHNFDGLKSFEGSLHISLIEKNFQKFIKNISNYSLDIDDWFKLLNSEKIKSPQKSKLHSYLTVDELSDSNIAKKVLNLHPDQKIKAYGLDEIKALLSHQGLLKARISILLKYIDDLSDVELKVIVSEFGELYKKLFKLKKRPSFPNNKEHELLLKNLIQRDIIKRIIPNGGKIKAICHWKK